MQEKEQNDIYTLKLRSTRGRPRLRYMEIEKDRNICKSPNRMRRLPTEPCVKPRYNETYLRVYNCDFIKPPRPDRFQRAMKQIYRPSKVLSHFVHYTIVTTEIAKYYSQYTNPEETYEKRVIGGDESTNDNNSFNTYWHDEFLNELTEGTLIHTKSVLPYETMTRTASCYNASKYTCTVGFECSEDTIFDDEIHTKNLFHRTDDGNAYCNCWVNPIVENYWLPKLEQALA